MATIVGRDMSSLRALAVRLARDSSFGDELMASASPSGKDGVGQVLVRLDLVHMNQIKSIIRQCARDKSEMEFEAIWSKCVSSISKACQNLRNGRLSKKRF